jgi:hypothetical protein
MSSVRRFFYAGALGAGAAMVIFASASGPASAQGQLTLTALASSNQVKLVNHVSIGMSKQDVISLMGNQTARTKDGIINNPWMVETSVGNDGAQYEALYYITRKNQPFTPVRKSLATAIVLKDGKVIAWGEKAFERYR